MALLQSFTLFSIFFGSFFFLFLEGSYSNAFAFVRPGYHHAVVHRQERCQLRIPGRLRTWRLDYSSDVNNFNITSSDQQMQHTKNRKLPKKDSITRTAEILAKRIVHRGVATISQQLRLQQQLKIREQQEREQRNISKQLEQQDPTNRFETSSQKYGPSAVPTPKSVKTAKDNLELKWSIDKSSEDCDVEDMLSCSEPCTTCRGTGIITCQFCNGTGYVDFGAQNPGTIGKRMEKNNGGHTGIECPVCNEDGDQCCQDCNGSGWIAFWRKKDEDKKY